MKKIIWIPFICLFISGNQTIQKKKAFLKTPHLKCIGKPRAAIDLKYTLQNQYKIGEVQKIEVIFDSKINIEQLTIGYSCTKGMQLNSNESQILTAKIKKATILFTPLKNGRHYINVIAKSHDSQNPKFNTFSIPIQLGTINNKKLKKTLVDSKGQRITSFKSR